MIQVRYHNDTTGIIESGRLEQLIDRSQIQSFLRSTGWVVLGQDKIRRAGGRTSGAERRRTDQESVATLRQRLAECERQLADLGLITAGLAHDCNNLMMAIHGNLELAQHKLPPPSPVEKNLAAIDLASRQAADLCKQMVTYVRQQGQAVTPLSLSQEVEEMRLLLQAIVHQKAQLSYRLAHPLAKVAVAGDQLRQLLVNLTLNGSDAIGSGREGTLTITTGGMAIDREYLAQAALGQEEPPGPYAFLEVADNGCGLAQEQIGQLFQPFSSTKGSDRGLGLAIVARICADHRAVVAVASQPNQGTTIRIAFPTVDSPSITAPGLDGGGGGR